MNAFADFGQVNCRPRSRITSALTLLITLGGHSFAYAELQPSFSLHYACDHAALIVVGSLDSQNELALRDVLYSETKAPPTVRLQWNGANRLRTTMREKPNATIDILAFLDKSGQPVLGSAGIVGLMGDRVYLIDGTGNSFKTEDFDHVLHPKLKKQQLIDATRNAIALLARRRALLTEKPSAPRARKLLDLLEQDSKEIAAVTPRDLWPDFVMRDVAKAMAPVAREEENVVIQALSDAHDESWRIYLLRFAAVAPLSGEAFELVANWVGREQPKQLREAAIAALASINNEWASERLLPMLSLDDPCFESLLMGVSAGSRHMEYWTRNPRTAEALTTLMQQLLDRPSGDPKTDQLAYHVLSAVYNNFHPRMLPILVQWSQSNKSSSWQVASTLRSVTALDPAYSNDVPLNAWWLAAHDLLVKRYDLKTTAGIDEWLEAYQQLEHPTAREMLHRLWLFEREVPEHYLLAQAESSNLRRLVAARAGLARLWQWGRLTDATKSAIIDRFVSVRLTEIAGAHNDTGGRELRIIARRKFAFPKNTWVQYSSDFSLDGRLPELRPGWSGRDMAGEGDFEIGSMGGGQYFGEPSVRAVAALQEFDHRTRQVVWTHRWNLGPLKLRKLDQPKRSAAATSPVD